MKKLIIVESPAKATTIKKFLGTNVKVIASKGHLRDLPKSRLGIDIENNFEPEYINVRGKGDLIKELKKEALSSDEIYLATDPDREGEAIAWHLSKLLGIDENKECRVTFNEITKETVKKSMEKPRKINLNTVDAQQARRVLDRIVGYKISPILWKKVKSGLSAGRVQTVALRLIVEKEREIRNFVPEEYWTLEVILEKDKQKVTAQFFGKDGKKVKISNEKQLNEILEKLNKEYIVKDVIRSERKKNPTPVFTTSTLQQAAARSLNYNIKKTMQIAQGLYEGVKIPGKGNTGLITYMRTDSTRISEEARKILKSEIITKFGEEYYEERYFKTSKNAQDGHEGIRPSYPDITPESIKEYLTKEQYALYSMIYKRTLASQMKPAVYDTMTVKFDNNNYEFRTNGSKIKFLGFLKIYDLDKYSKAEKEEENEGINSKNDIEEIQELVELPDIHEKDIFKEKKQNKKQSFTEPPARYTEASLVKVLEANGIGRPSTYSPTINTIIERRYVKKEKKAIVPTELGEIVTDLLLKYFENIFNVKFTANIEEEFDIVEEGKEKWKKIITNFYKTFEENLGKATDLEEKIEIKDEESDIDCDKCGRKMVYKIGRFGRFLACSRISRM